MKAKSISVVTSAGSDYFSDADYYLLENALLCVEENKIKYYFPLCNVTFFVVKQEGA